MNMIEDTLKLSPLFTTLSEEEKNKLVQRIIFSLSYIANLKEENPLILS